MKIVLITHAKTSNKPPRRLSLVGGFEVEQVVDMIKGKLGERYRIQKAVSSPAARCLDTALVCLEEIGADDISKIDTDHRLARLFEFGGIARHEAGQITRRADRRSVEVKAHIAANRASRIVVRLDQVTVTVD